MANAANELEKEMHLAAQAGSAPGETSPANDVLEDASDLGPQKEPQKRGRGRPPKSESALEEQLNQGQIPPKTEGAKRGPKPGARKGNKSGLDVSQLGQQLVGVHSIAAAMTGIATLNIAPAEGEALAKSIVEVCNQYDLAVDGKTGAFIGLAATAAMIYGPRYFLIRAQMDAAKRAAQQHREQQHNPQPQYQGQVYDNDATPGNFAG